MYPWIKCQKTWVLEEKIYFGGVTSQCRDAFCDLLVGVQITG